MLGSQPFSQCMLGSQPPFPSACWEANPPPPPRTEWHTGVKTLACPKFLFAGGNKIGTAPIAVQYEHLCIMSLSPLNPMISQSRCRSECSCVLLFCMIFTARKNEVWGKVIISQVSVCPRGVSLTETPPRYGKERAVRILLECIRVACVKSVHT